MKRFLFFIFLLITNWYGMLAQNDAMLIYRNDGIVHGFLKADVDSVRHSQLDLDSVMHKDFVVQEVWRADSVYRIPLEVIDSVSFVMPPTIYKQGVVDLKERLLDYVIGANGLTLKLKANVPSSLIPAAGDKLVLLDGCRSLPNGFSGIVQNIQTTTEGVEVICERAYMEDLFDSFCSVSTLYVSGGEQAQAKYITARGASTRADFGTSKWGTLTISCASQILPNVFPDSDLALQLGAEASIAVTPKLRIHAFTILGDGNGFYFNGSVTGNLEVASKLALYGSIDYNKDFTDPKLEKGIAIPGTACLVDYYFAPGFFVHANATISESVTDVRNFQIGMNFDYSSIGENVLKPVPPTLRLVSSSTEMEGCIDGSLAAGIFVEKGFNIWSRGVGKVCCRGELGMQVSGNFVLRNSDIDNSEGTELYERIKKTSIEAGPYANLQLQASILGIGPSVTLSERSNFKKWDLVPTFSNTQLSRLSGSATSALAYTQLSGKCLFPISVGYKLYDDNRNEVADYTASVAYRDKECKFEHIFSNLDATRDYTIYPKVSLFGHDLLASPSADLEKAKKSIVKITNFKQTDSEYSKNGFSNDGMTYDYKFDVAVTVEIDNIDGVADWGYVYKDPNGNIKRISLMQYGKSCIATQTFYRNETRSTVCLYGYVRYEGGNEYYYFEECTFDVLYASLESSLSIRNPEVAFISPKINEQDFSISKYQYGVSFDIWLPQNDDIADCGYVYEDLEGGKNFVSMYGNETHAYDNLINIDNDGRGLKMRLYGYAKKKNEDKYVYGTPQIIELPAIHSCPDDNHPHAIDMKCGGVKWACCNVGASAPFEYGGYYARGETKEKDCYDWNTYKHYDEKTNTITLSLDTDISGTSNDAAYVNMGGTWRMPTPKQMMSLCSNATSVLYKINGVYGHLYTGKNGAQIFFPGMGGYKLEREIKDATSGCYWLSSNGFYGSSNSFIVREEYNRVGCCDGQVCLGFAVRGVCP